ncbi:MAG TPA: hypothetical protein DHN33_08605 [Eubacteriaceae bacterium]|nr:hypothetical protein [Eubacteriaceae bacterium]
MISIIAVVLSPYLALLPLAGIAYKVLRGDYEIPINPLNFGFFLLFVWSLISGVLNESMESIIGSGVILLFLSLNVFLQNQYAEEEKIYDLVKKVWQISMIAGILGLTEKILSYFYDMTWVSDLFWSPNYIPTVENYRIYATFGNPNVAGSWFAAMVLVSIYLFEKNRGRQGIPYATGIVLFSLTLIFTGSIGATAALLLALLVYMVLSKNRTLRFILLGIFAFVLLVALSSPEVNHSLNPRNNLWIESMQLFLEKPLAGWGLFGILETIGNIHSHNIWIQLIATFGLVGLSIYMWARTYVYQTIQKLYKRGSSIVPLLASVQGVMIFHGIVDFTLMTPQGGILFFGSASLLSALVWKEEKYPVIAKRPRRARAGKVAAKGQYYER